MIIVKLSGGIGNQMFQYAFGKFLSIHHKKILKLDIENFGKIKSETSRKFALSVFNIFDEVATKKEISQLKYSGKFGNLLYYFNFLKKTHIKEEDDTIVNVNDILKNHGSTYLEGYWQNYQYINKIEKVLRKKFTFKEPLDQKYKFYESDSSVSVHIRRGDYLTNPPAKNFYLTCSKQYYFEAISLISKKIQSPKFYIFSDDIKWAKKNLVLNYPVVFVSNPHIKDHVELQIMSKCSHNIIANSSFSWWGAWLNKNENKIVIAPKKWYKDEKLSLEKIILPQWIQI